MTPLQLQMMLHYYAIAAPYAQHDPGHANSPAVFEQRGELIEMGLLEERHSLNGYRVSSGFGVTDRGEAYIMGLLSVPLPEKQWTIKWPATPLTSAQ